MTSPRRSMSAERVPSASVAVTSSVTRLPSATGAIVAAELSTGAVLSTVNANAVELTGWAEASPGVTVAVKETEPSASVVVSTVMSYTGPAAPVAGVNVFPPPASETDLTPEVERAATWMLTVPRTGSPACLPAAPTIATVTLPVDVPAMHFPAGPHTGKPVGHDASSTQGISPPEGSEQPASARAERTPMARSFDDSIIPALARPPAAKPAFRLYETQQA